MEHLEGRESVLAALKAGERRFQVILIRQGMHAEKLSEVVALAARRGVPVRRAEPRELAAVAHGATHGGIVAICSAKPRMSVADLLRQLDASRTRPLLLLLEGIDDARNLGFTLRTADAMGVNAVLIKKHLWDFDTVEVARPASGAYERMPLVQIEDVGTMKEFRRREITLVGCVPRAKRTIHEVNLRVPTILAIGGEKRGLSGALRGLCDVFATIPIAGEQSSLSLSHAAAIVLAEAMRQRRATTVSDYGETISELS